MVILANNNMRSPLPKALASLPNLRYLDLSVSPWFPKEFQNTFDEPLPTEIFREDSKLEQIYLIGNKLKGSQRKCEKNFIFHFFFLKPFFFNYLQAKFQKAF